VIIFPCLLNGLSSAVCCPATVLSGRSCGIYRIRAAVAKVSGAALTRVTSMIDVRLEQVHS